MDNIVKIIYEDKTVYSIGESLKITSMDGGVIIFGVSQNRGIVIVPEEFENLLSVLQEILIK